jgi:hypothetical protein
MRVAFESHLSRARWMPSRRSFAHCDVAARDLLMLFGDVMMALSIVLRIKRTLNGAEIDELISDVQARKTRAIELARRADWHRRELSARRFQAE